MNNLRFPLICVSIAALIACLVNISQTGQICGITWVKAGEFMRLHVEFNK